MLKAIEMVELISIARGIFAADRMLKSSDVEIETTNAVCPGKYLIIVHGSISAVQKSVAIGEGIAGEYFIDSIVIPNVSANVFPAITGTTMPDKIKALGIVESSSLATMIIATAAILKAANLQALELRLGNGLGGKAYFTFTGIVAAVISCVQAGKTIDAKKVFW